MAQRYQDAIAEIIRIIRARFANGADLTDAEVMRGKCREASETLVEKFPELKKVCGFCNGQEHFWCVTPAGEIVDGSAVQFEAPFLEYDEYDESRHVIQIGRCMDCGEPIYGKMSDSRKDFCNNDCVRRYAEYVGDTRPACEMFAAENEP